MQYARLGTLLSRKGCMANSINHYIWCTNITPGKTVMKCKACAAAVWTQASRESADNQTWARTPTSALNLTLRFLPPLREISVERSASPTPDNSALLCYRKPLTDSTRLEVIPMGVTSLWDTLCLAEGRWRERMTLKRLAVTLWIFC